MRRLFAGLGLVGVGLGIYVSAMQLRHPSDPTKIPPTSDESYEALYARAKFELEQGRAQVAERNFAKAADASRNDEQKANALLGMGSAIGEEGDHARALAALEQVAALRPDDVDAWRVVVAEAHAGGKREAEARGLEKVTALDEDALSAYLDLAGLYAALGRSDRSKDVYLRYELKRKALILDLAEDKDPGVRATTCRALAGARDAATAKALVLALTDRATPVRLACARAIGDIGVDIDPEIRPALTAFAARERDPEVRAAAADALKMVRP
jgi:tetratricopeptide (TPR) repeat protein